MPKIGKQKPVQIVQRLNGEKIADELFHLERTISNSDRMNADVRYSIDELIKAVDILADHTQSLVVVMEEVRDLLKKKEDDA